MPKFSLLPVNERDDCVYIYITLCDKSGSQQLLFRDNSFRPFHGLANKKKIVFQCYEREKLKVLWIHKNYGKKPLCNAQSITEQH